MSSHTLEGKKKTQNGVKRLAFTVLSILLEVVFLIGIFKGLNEYAVFIDNLTRIFAVILVLKIYGRNETSSMKTPWIILILTFPILGVALYFMIGMNGGTRKMRMRYKRIDEKLLPLLPENKEVLERLNVSDPKAGNVSNYIERNACYPVYQNTDVTYFDEAVKGLEAQLTDLAKAEQFIFMEYHAIEDEYAWSRIQTVLEERVKAGVEVRVFYDDMGSIGLAVYGIGLSFWEKYTGKALFYAVGRDWGQGCYVANSGLVLFISALCFAPSFPVKGYAGILCCVLIACLLNMVLRGFMNLLQSRRETRLLWEIGTADTRINWKGKGYLCGHHMKVRVQGSEKGTEIPAGAPVMVVGMEGFKPVVAQV